jgi:hypothetical protein
MGFKFLSELPAINGNLFKGSMHSGEYVLPAFPKAGKPTLYRVASD